MKKILLVEDEIEIQSLIADLLRNRGILVDAYANGAQATQALQKQDYDLIITDLSMPGEDGFSFIYKVKNVLSKKSKIPILVITGRAKDASFHAGLENIKDYNVGILTKPFMPGDLLTSVSKVFNVPVDKLDTLYQN